MSSKACCSFCEKKYIFTKTLQKCRNVKENNILIFVVVLLNFIVCVSSQTSTQVSPNSGTAAPPSINIGSGGDELSNRLSGFSGGGGGGGSCFSVNQILLNRGIKSVELQNKESSDLVSKYCEVSVTRGRCCTYNMELKLAQLSRQQLDRNTKESIGKLASILGTRAQKFNDNFKDLLQLSKKEFHLMFKRTYGAIYEKNSYVFSDLFNELERYYLRGNVDLSDIMDSFFNTLYQKMFTVLNGQYKFDDKYLGCVSEHMKELKPFGDVPHKLSLQIKRSFVATRTYAQSLNAAAEVVKSMVNVRPSADCTTALTKLQQCGLCNGYVEKPCSNYCVNVMKGCLNHYGELNLEWDNFVVAMEKLSERLLGPFNIVMVVEPINIKISEAIMNFQETGHDISTQVFHGCGKPQLGRRRRSSDNLDKEGIKLMNSILDLDQSTKNLFYDTSFTFDDSLETKNPSKSMVRRSADPGNRELQTYEPVKFTNTDEYQNSNNRGRKKNKNRGNKGGGLHEASSTKSGSGSEEYPINTEPDLDKLIKDIRQKVRDSKRFWSNLPYQICNDISSLPTNEGQCWNGKTIDRYPHAVVTEQQLNPEFPNQLPLTSRQNSLVANKLFVLKTSINHLRTAYNGLDVEWTDQEENTEYGSGSGSGISGEDDIEELGSGTEPFDFESTRLNPIDHTPSLHIPPAPDAQPNPYDPEIIVDPSITPEVTTDSINDNTILKDVQDGSTSVASAPDQISMHRALFTYIFPIVMAWFGGCFADLL